MEEALLTRSSRSLNQKSSESIGIERNGSSFQAIVDELQSPFSTITFPLVFSTIIAICGSYVFGHAVGYSSPAESGIIKDLGLTSSEYSLFSSILTVGGMLGAVLSGKIADLIGRRAAMGVAEVLSMAGWLATLLSEAAWTLYLGRFLLGCGIGLMSYAVPIYIAEITPKRVRGGFTALNPLMMGFGQSLAFLYGSLLNWRILAAIGLIPGIIQLPGLFFIPESPRWLAKLGRLKDFEASLQHLRGPNADITQEAAEIKDYTLFLQYIQQEDGFLNLFQRRYARVLIVGLGLMLFQRFGGTYAFLFYATTIFEAGGFSSTVGTIAAAIVQLIGTTIGALVIDKYGRRPMLLISSVGACLGCILTGLAFLFQDFNLSNVLSASLVFVGVLLYLGFLQVGLGGIPWIIMSEIFPINIKGAAGSLVILISWIGSLIIAYTFTYLFDWSSAGTFFIYGGICAAGILFIATLVPETRGRALEEIQDSLVRSMRCNVQ
ncbi:hypothetical protein SLA2020_504710 [Shorea laevis]